MQGIADYEFLRSLGSGNHGQFFLARRPARLPIDVEYVAVKVLSGESTADTFRRATREMKAFASVRSPYLVTLYDAGQHDGIFYYSMEYLPEGSLAQPAHPLDQTAALRAVADAARAAAALHAAGIVHRDIKPSNVLLTTVGREAVRPWSVAGVHAGRHAHRHGVDHVGGVHRSGSPARRAARARTTTCGRSASCCTGRWPAPASTATCRRTTACWRCAGSCRPSRRSRPRCRRAVADIVRECLAPPAQRPAGRRRGGPARGRRCRLSGVFVLTEGSTFAAYEVRRRLAVGGMGEVYLCRHRMLDRLDAVKVLRPHLASDDDFRRRFLREALSAARVRHPQRGDRLHRRRGADGLLYLAMEYVAGEDLAGVAGVAPDRWSRARAATAAAGRGRRAGRRPPGAAGAPRHQAEQPARHRRRHDGGERDAGRLRHQPDARRRQRDHPHRARSSARSPTARRSSCPGPRSAARATSTRWPAWRTSASPARCRSRARASSPS